MNTCLKPPRAFNNLRIKSQILTDVYKTSRPLCPTVLSAMMEMFCRYVFQYGSHKPHVAIEYLTWG